MLRPNIVYIHSHDTGRQIQPYAPGVATPALQRLAAEGVLLRRTFCAAPTCSPSRAALLTGQWAHCSGMIGLAHRGFRLHDPTRHLAHFLAEHGYHTVLAGLQHVADDPATTGYADIRTPHDRHAASVAPVAVDFLQSAPPQPFFLDIGFFETHREFPDSTGRIHAGTLTPPHPIADTPATRRDFADYCAMATDLDTGVATVLAALDETGLAGNTLVIYTTDHGPAFPGMKCNLTDAGIGVAMILRGPGEFGGARVVDAMLSHIDLFPTLCEWLDLPAPAWLQGHSFLPVLRGERAEINDALYAEVTYHAAYEPQRAIRTQRHKYIRRYGARALPVLPNCDDSPSKDLWIESGWSQLELPREALYDLTLDPGESANLVAAPHMAPTLAELRSRLDAWMRATDDPLLRGDVPPPPGVLINDPAGLSPRETPTRIAP